jgi:4-hydroxythreonine-4-phosphate dehydrogenase
MSPFQKIAITTGDIDGIGSEVTSKALYRIRPQRGVQFFLWRSPMMPSKELRKIDRSFKRVTVSSWPEALKLPVSNHKVLVDIQTHLPPARWVEMMAQAAMSKKIDGIVTAPLSKTGVIQAGYRDNGHTGILQRVSKSKELFMSFLGKHMNVTLVTGHTSVKKAYDQITSERLQNCIGLTHRLLPYLSRRYQGKPIGLVGCNPHAGESGLIDPKEIKIYEPVLKKMRQKKIKISGPLIPDVCFQDKERKKYSFYIASYHDQGLIPFKMLHGTETGVHVTLGLPFIRTSVDHGTAKDIFGQNKAHSGSMEEAILTAVKLIKNKRSLVKNA